MNRPSTTFAHLLGALGLAAFALASHGAEPAATFAGHWEDCENFADACYGYRLEQKGGKVCGSITRAAKAEGEAHRYGHLRGEVSGDTLKDVAVCGIESRTPCPTIMPANRRGLLLCGDEMFETGGRIYTCANYSDRHITKPYRRVSAEAFAKRFGTDQPALCKVPVISDLQPPAKR